MEISSVVLICLQGGVEFSAQKVQKKVVTNGSCFYLLIDLEMFEGNELLRCLLCLNS